MHLQAEQTLFKVHRSLMSRHSDFFKDMLTLPPTSDDPSASAPLFLPDVSSDAFANLLRIVYCVFVNRPRSRLSLTSAAGGARTLSSTTRNTFSYCKPRSATSFPTF